MNDPGRAKHAGMCLSLQRLLILDLLKKGNEMLERLFNVQSVDVFLTENSLKCDAVTMVTVCLLSGGPAGLRPCHSFPGSSSGRPLGGAAAERKLHL